jgi:hypothetical protein
LFRLKGCGSINPGGGAGTTRFFQSDLRPVGERALSDIRSGRRSRPGVVSQRILASPDVTLRRRQTSVLHSKVSQSLNAKLLGYHQETRSRTLAVEVNALSLNAQCESVTASQTLADIITGDIYIGTATNDYEWETTMQKKTNIDVPGRTPSNSMEFQTVTVQGAVMTFAALGDPAYFEDPRALTQTVNIQDIHTVHFLEPLSGKGGPSPHFDAVKSFFLDGDAFTLRTDPTNHTSWLEPTPALLAICPRRPTAGRMVCITRVESNVLIQYPLDVVEIRPGEQSSVSNMQNLMSRVIAQGGGSAYTRMMGTNFSHQLIKKLNLNTRYRKAYVVNPVVDWSYQAMQFAQAGSTALTVCTKIIAIGMLTINTPAGTQLARRLLSTTFDLTPNEDSHSSARRELMLLIQLILLCQNHLLLHVLKPLIPCFLN